MSIVDLDLPDANGTVWSALVRDIDSGETLFERAADAVLDTASVGKVFLLHRLLSEVDAGTRSLEERVTRRPVESIDDSGLWYLLQASELSLYDVAALIGAVSDNAATNTLGRVIGLPTVQEHARALGYTASGLDDIVRWPRPPGGPRTLSHANAEEMVRFMARLATGADLSPSSADTLLRWLGAGMDLSMVASAFDLDPLAHHGYDRGLWLINKTGTNSSVRADTGIVMSPTRRIGYAVLANWQSDTDGRGPVLAAMRAIGDAIRTELSL